MMLGQGSIFHSRRSNGENQFSYPTFFLYFNVDEEGRFQQLLTRTFHRLLSLRARDYLDAQSEDNFGQAIRTFAQSRLNFTPEEIWLQTMPRMFGYAFNPVSFWVFKRGGQPEAVLVEVNNTFGERHFYWIGPNSFRQGEWHRTAKAFHVSPFQPLEGNYEFRFRFASDNHHIDINYRGADGQMRLLTWIKGKLSNLETHSAARLLWRYGWMTPLVVIRIHYQALRLFFKRARFFSKPSPPKELVT